VATTAESIRVYAEKILGVNIGHLKGRGIVTAGRGNVGGPFVDRVLADDGITPDVALDTADQVIHNATHLQGRPVRVLFSMARGYHVIDARHLTPPKPDRHPYSGITLVVDAGNAQDPTSLRWGGSIDPDTLVGTNVFATPFRKGLGPLTVALLYERLIQNAERELAQREAQQRYEQSALGRLHRRLGALATSIATRLKNLVGAPEAAKEGAPDDASELADDNELANA
jgi:5,10-methylene-tetrahydrofolate dehydrogenase/methenyl tetrahydrofolate cyclohydrolase